jgi:hypothetical protein
MTGTAETSEPGHLLLAGDSGAIGEEFVGAKGGAVGD